MDSASSDSRIPRVIVLPRGINVGGNNKVPMPALRDALARRGYTGVRTLLASGNIIVPDPGGERGADTVCDAVRECMDTDFGVAVDCVARTDTEMRDVLAADPFGKVAVNGSRYLVTFLSAPLSPELVAEYEATDLGPGEYVFAGREVFTWAPEGVLSLRLDYSRLAKDAGCAATARNWNTVAKIVAAL
ncbi:DUF1697 domain-containing protein [Dietzia sp.]|uniref:DUF1697 domain-containing protein n=1 Tax=Dietzia sp. TaxID=1871616 RepID=UPI002FD95445